MLAPTTDIEANEQCHNRRETGGERNHDASAPGPAHCWLGLEARRRQGLRELGRTGVAIGGHLRQCLQHGALDSRRDGVPHRPDGSDGIDGVPGQDRLRGGAIERRRAGEHLVDHAAQRVQVAPPVHRAALVRLLGTHVGRSAKRDARLGEPVATRTADRASDAEVGDQCAAVREQDVLGLDVPMYHAQAVGVAQRVGHVACDAERISDR